MKKSIAQALVDAQKAVALLQEQKAISFIETASKIIADAFVRGNKLLIAGNGGSLCDAMHFAEELTGFFRKYRGALPAIALGEPGHLTCVANDRSFAEIFSRGVEAYGKKDDVLIVLTTSGNSENISYAVSKAKEQQMFTIAFLGKDGGKLKNKCDLELIIRGFTTSDRIQEAHMTAIHVIIEMIERLLFPSLYENNVETEAEMLS